MKGNSKQGTQRGGQQAAGKRIPDEPRDCGPHVDTWPILDKQQSDAPQSKTGERDQTRADGNS